LRFFYSFYSIDLNFINSLNFFASKFLHHKCRCFIFYTYLNFFEYMQFYLCLLMYIKCCTKSHMFSEFYLYFNELHSRQILTIFQFTNHPMTVSCGLFPLHLFLCTWFTLLFLFFIHMCIQCLGHFSPFNHPLPLPPTPSIPSRNYFALISNFVVLRV
jgi:hypothetical protein